MNIAILTDCYLPQINGVVTSTRTLFRELENKGHKVLIIGPKVMGVSEKSTHKVWRFRSVPFPFQKEYRLISPISRKLKEFKDMKIDVIHVQTPFSMGHLGQYLSWKYDIPMVHTYHTYWAEYSHYLPFIPARFVYNLDNLLFSRNFCNRCEHIIAPSNQIMEKLNSYGVTVPIEVIPTGIEFGRIDTNYDPKEFRSKYKIKEDSPILVFTGRCGIEKNVYFLLDSFKMILAAIPNAILFIAGDGPEKDNMLMYAEELEIDNNLIMAGYIPHQEVFQAYRAAELIVFPSKTETQGLSLVEGLAMGTPAVCINAMGVSSILENNYGGILSEDNIEDYANNVIKLLNDKILYEKKSLEAKKRALQFSSSELVDKIIAIYEKSIDIKKNSSKKKLSIEKYFKGPFWRFLKG
jgi:1,2-diacylglycerol 3-alpha-glucosyltransferase